METLNVIFDPPNDDELISDGGIIFVRGLANVEVLESGFAFTQADDSSEVIQNTETNAHVSSEASPITPQTNENHQETM